MSIVFPAVCAPNSLLSRLTRSAEGRLYKVIASDRPMIRLTKSTDWKEDKDQGIH